MTSRTHLHQAALPQRTSIALGLVIIVALGSLVWATTARGPLLLAKLLWVCAIGFMASRVFRTGSISFWRSAFFIILAWAFIVHFKAKLIGLTGRAFVAPDVQEVPYCHIAIASSFLTYLYQQYTALMSGAWGNWSPLTWGALWLLVTLVLGQAWCSWACMYGGLDSGFARLRTRPLVKWKTLPKGVRELPVAILVAMLLISLAMMRPAFCLWMCPLKLGTGFLDPNTLTRTIQLIVFATIGIVFVIVLPLLTNKRAFCGLICPFGAWQAFFGRLNPYRVTISESACTQCQRCVTVCPTFAIEPEGLKRHAVLPYCNRCGECMDACPTGAIDYTVVGQRWLTLPSGWARRLFLMTAWVVAGAVSLLFVPDAMLTLWRVVFSWVN